MFVVALTGGIGSGKSEAARMFAALGVPVIDTDAIAHQLTAPGQPALQAIAAAFGAEYLLPDGTLDRARLRQRVFDDEAARLQLQAILHPLIREEATRKLAASQPEHYAMLVVPLLFETGGYRDLISRSLVIDCDESLQRQRAMARSGLSEDAVRGIMAAQCSRQERLWQADDVIENSGSLEELAEKVSRQHEKYIKTCMLRQSIS